MAFFVPKDVFTHKGSFYGVPVYYILTDEDLVVSGTNLLTEDLLRVAALFHDYVVEPAVQFTTAILGVDYQPGYPFWVSNEPLHK